MPVIMVVLPTHAFHCHAVARAQLPGRPARAPAGSDEGPAVERHSEARPMLHMGHQLRPQRVGW